MLLHLKFMITLRSMISNLTSGVPRQDGVRYFTKSKEQVISDKTKFTPRLSGSTVHTLNHNLMLHRKCIFAKI